MKKKIKVLVFCPGLIPSVIIGVLRPLLALKKDKKIHLKVRLSGLNLFLKQEMGWCDVAVFCRNTEYRDLIYLYELKKLGKRVIYEIDDNFFELPLDTPVGYYHRNYMRLYVVKRFLELSDEVRVYSKIIQEIALKYNKNVFLINSYFDSQLLKNMTHNGGNEKIKIVYPTNRLDSPSLEQLLFKVIKKINELYKHKIEFHFWGKTKPKFLDEFNNAVMHQPILNYEQFILYFYSQQFDIGLAPLMEGRFYASKTNNKYREFGGCAIAGIYPNLPPYSDCIISKKNGILVENHEDNWVEALCLLIENAHLRQNIVDDAKADVLINYSFQKAVTQMMTSLEKSIHNNTYTNIEHDYNRKINLIYVGRNQDIFHQLKIVVEDLREVDSKLLINLPFKSLDLYQDNLNDLKNADLIIFQLEQANDLEKILGLIGYCKQIALDFTRFQDISSIQFNFSLKNVVKIILNQEHHNFFESLSYEYLIRYKKIEISSIEEEFTLQGYRGLFLEIFDNIKGEELKSYNKIKHILKKIMTYFDLNIVRFKRLSLLIGYRYGFKKING